jgi:hypothetical protein
VAVQGSDQEEVGGKRMSLPMNKINLKTQDKKLPEIA